MSASERIEGSGESLLSVRRLQPALSAEINGVDLRRPMNEALRDAIYQALLRYKVIVFRDQEINREQHVAFGRAFGDLEIEYQQLPEYPEIVQFKAEGRPKTLPPNSIWHTDHSCLRTPPLATVLRAYVVPSLGGDTMFASAVAAYNGLDEETKARIENLEAVHRVDRGLRSGDVSAELLARMPPVTHPIVCIHPDTGERVLFVNARYTDRIIGLPHDESEALLRHLADQFKRPEYQFRLSWRPHTLVMWDNRSVQHCAVVDYDEARHLERVTVIGKTAVSPLGARQSRDLQR